MSKVTNRISILIPAAGVFTEIRAAGHLFYLESSGLDSTVAGACTVHIDTATGDGIPMYPKMEVRVCAGFKRLYVKGTTLTAGSNIDLFVVSDPCVDIGDVAPVPCGASLATATAPDPASLFPHKVFFVWGGAAAPTANTIQYTLEATISWAAFVASSALTKDVRDMATDRVNNILYWCTGTLGSTQDAVICSASYDPATGAIVGSVNTLLNNTTDEVRGITLDVSNTRLYFTTAGNKINWIPIGGGSKTVLAGTFSNPNRLGFYLKPGTTLGVLDICLDGIGEVMRYDIDSTTDLGPLISPSDYDEISLYGPANIVFYRRDGNTIIRRNDYETYLTEDVTIATTTGQTTQFQYDPFENRLYYVRASTDNDIASVDVLGVLTVDEGALPSATGSAYPRFALG